MLNHLHSCVTSFVYNHSFSCLVNIMIQAKVCSHSVQQHPVIGGHRGKLPILNTEKEKNDTAYDNIQAKHIY